MLEEVTKKLQDKNGVRLVGEVCWFNSTRGFGFVFIDKASEDTAYVHRSQIVTHKNGYRNLKRGELIEFTLAVGSDGKKTATEVVRLNPPAGSASSSPAITAKSEAR